MIEIYLFGWLLLTLSGGLSVFFLVTALLSIAFLAATGISLLRTLSAVARALPPVGSAPHRASSRIGVAVAAAVLVLALAGVRVGMDGGATRAIATGIVGFAAAVAAGTTTSCLWLLGAGGLDALSGVRQRQRALDQARKQARSLRLRAAEQRFLEGGDLRDEVAGAEASLQKLRMAIQAMEEMRAGIAQRMEATGQVDNRPPADPPGSPAAGGLREEYERLRDEIDMKIDLGRRVLLAAEAAAFRLACAEPLRRLFRRRPSEAMKGLSRAKGAAETETEIAGVARAVQAFVDQIPEAREGLSALQARRPAAMTDASQGDGAEHTPAGGAKDALHRARRELDAVESAYRTILDRIEVIRLRFATRAEMEQVAKAAGSVTASAEALGHSESDLSRLIDELARAESAITMIAPENTNLQAFTDAVARSAVALDCNDTTTLAELIEAMREIG